MKRNRAIKFIGVSCIGLLFYFSCIREDFYSDTMADFDLLRLPLIKPFAIYSADIQYAESWNASVSEEDSKIIFDGVRIPGRPGIDSVGINGSLILVYSSHEIINGHMTSAWFVFDTEIKKGIHFLDQKGFYEHLENKFNIYSVKFYDPTTVYTEFRENNKLPSDWYSYNKY